MFRKSLIIITLAIIMSPVYSSSILYAITAKEIVVKSEKIMRGETQIAIVLMTIKTRRWKRTMEMKWWQVSASRKSFSEILAPKKDAGNRFLLIKQRMHHYIPKLQKAIKISPSMMLQSWMGSDFSNDDIVKESSKIEDYTHELGGKETVDGHECYKIVLKPKKDAAVVWGKMILYLRVKDYLPVKEEYYNQHNVLKKYMKCSNFKKVHDRVIPTKLVMQTVKKKDKYTIMEIKNARFNVNIPGKIFTLQNLKRR